MAKQPGNVIVKQPGSSSAPVQQPYSWYMPAPPAWNPALPPPPITPVTGITPANYNQQFPGAVMGARWADVIELIRKQKKAKGILLQSTIDTTTTVRVPLSGVGKIFLGLKIGTNLNLADPDATVTLTINDEVIFSGVSTFFLSNDFALNSVNCEYFSFLRPLSGNDDIRLTVTEATVAILYEFNFYYL